MKLFTALGENYDVIMEMVDFLSGSYAYAESAQNTKKQFTKSLDEIVLFCTKETLPVFQGLKIILGQEYPQIRVSCIDLMVSDIRSSDDEENIRDKVFVTFEQYQEADLILSSAGRKDITQRMVEAGYIFGFRGYLSLTLPMDFYQFKKTTTGLKDYQIIRNHPEYLTVNWYPLSTFLRRRYRLPEDDSPEKQGTVSDIKHPEQPELIRNFSALYSLPLSLIQRLKSEKIGANNSSAQRDYDWLRSLPKTDLHCHFGGAAGPRDLKTIAETIASDPHLPERWKEGMTSVRNALRNNPLPDALKKKSDATNDHPLRHLREHYRQTAPNLPVFLTNAVQLSLLSGEDISDLMWYDYEMFSPGLETYMNSGNFGGSMLLQTRTALEKAMQCLLEASLKDNIQYLEVRVSPMNYCDAGLSISEVMEILLETSGKFMKDHPQIMVNFIIMATRHKDKASISKNISTAIVFSEDMSGRPFGKSFQDKDRPFPCVCGVDLAGQEEGFNPMQFEDIFQPLHYHFIKITIHAGETESSDNIWEALYCLHAKRIGHGLKLYQNKRMIEYLRDFHVSLEMCPTSNVKTCTYRVFSNTTPAANQSTDKETYPLQHYLQEGVGVTINTDNRGISRTNLTDEYLKACQLTEGGLSKWEILKLIRQGFVSSFLSLQQKNILLNHVERQVLSLVINEYLETDTIRL